MSNANINPAVLLWARETAGLDLGEAAERIGFTTTAKATAEEKLAEIEAGNKPVSRTQLAKIASVYRRPLITFYLRTPPIKGDRGEDFRQTAGSITKREDALLDSLLRDLRARQEMVKSLLDDEDETRAPFAGTATISEGVEAVVNIIATKLDFDYTSKLLRKGNADDLFRLLRAKSEEAGVFVMLVGDLGSFHTSLSADVFRGFAIADKLAPFVVINDQDARAARSFTLIHELAHIVLGESGVSGNPTPNAPRDAHGVIERFCNDVAGEFLLSRKILGPKPEILNQASKDEAAQIITGIAEQWSVSEAMAAYRLNSEGWIPNAIYEALIAEYVARWRATRQKTKDERSPDDGGPSYYVVKQHKLGAAIIEVVRRSLRDNVLTHTKAAQILGVKPTSVEPLLRGYEKSRINASPAGAS